MTKPASRLGRGLSALIPAKTGTAAASPPTESAALAPDAGQVRDIAYDRIHPNARQPRSTFAELPIEELADSIRANGVLQPIIVRPSGPDRYEIVAGERRWRASQMAGRRTVPALIRDLSDAEAVEIALLENLRREDLSPLERARAYQRYIDEFGVTTEELATKLSESRSNVANYLRLLRLSPEVLTMLGAGELTMGHARAIAGLTNSERQLALARLASRRNLSVRQIETLAQQDGPIDEHSQVAHAPAASILRTDRHLDAVAKAFSKALGVEVTINSGKKKNSGRIVIAYDNLDDFDRVAERIGVRSSLE